MMHNPRYSLVIGFCSARKPWTELAFVDCLQPVNFEAKEVGGFPNSKGSTSLPASLPSDQRHKPRYSIGTSMTFRGNPPWWGFLPGLRKPTLLRQSTRRNMLHKNLGQPPIL